MALAFPGAFSRLTPSDQNGMLTQYLRHLSDVPIEVLRVAVDRLIRTESWFPSIAGIRLVCAELLLDLPGEEEALRQVSTRAHWRREAPDQEPPDVHPLVQEAVDRVGGLWALRTSERPSVVIGQFTKVYREMRGNAVREACAGDLSSGLQHNLSIPRTSSVS